MHTSPIRIGINLIEHSIQSHHKVSCRILFGRSQKKKNMEIDISRVFLVFIFNYLTMPLEILSKLHKFKETT